MKSSKIDINYNQGIIIDGINTFAEKLRILPFASNGICDHLSSLFLCFADDENLNQFYGPFRYLIEYSKLEKAKKELSEKTRPHIKVEQFIRSLYSLFINPQTPFKLLGAYWLNSSILAANNDYEFTNLINTYPLDAAINTSRLFRVDIGIAHSIALVCKNINVRLRYILYNSNDKGVAREFFSKTDLAKAICGITNRLSGSEKGIILNLHEISFDYKNEEFIKREDLITKIYDTITITKETQTLSLLEKNIEILIDEYKRGKISQLNTYKNIIFLINSHKDYLPENISMILNSFDNIPELDRYDISEKTFYDKLDKTGKIALIHLACYNGDLLLLERLLAKGVNINQKLANGWDPIYLAVNKGHALVVETLIRNNANFKQTFPGDDSGDNSVIPVKISLAHVVALLNDYETFKILFNHFNFKIPDTFRLESPLTVAAINGNLSFLMQLLDEYPNYAKEIKINDVLRSIEAHQISCADYLLDKFINCSRQKISNVYNQPVDEAIFKQLLEASTIHPMANKLYFELNSMRKDLFEKAIRANSLSMLQLITEKYGFNVDQPLIEKFKKLLDSKNPELSSYLLKKALQSISLGDKKEISNKGENSNKFFDQKTQTAKEKFDEKLNKSPNRKVPK